MGLFKADLFRSFAVGFALGAAALAVVMGGGTDGIGGAMVPNAVAAPAHPG